MRINSVVLAVALILPFISPASADTQHLFLGGFAPTVVTSLNWTYSTNSTYATTYITPAANSWNGISSRVRLNKVTSGVYRIRASLETTNILGRVGLTIPYCNNNGTPASGSACSSNKAWGSAQVIAYSNQMAILNYNTTNIISNYAHEFGHALSLRHVVDTSTYTYPPAVMKQGISSLEPQLLDKTHLRQKWGS